MKYTTTALILAALVAATTAVPVAEAQGPSGRSGRGGKPRGEVTVDWTKIDSRIAWFGTMDAAQAAAKKTGRPILLVAGAPHCRAVPGVW